MPESLEPSSITSFHLAHLPSILLLKSKPEWRGAHACPDCPSFFLSAATSGAIHRLPALPFTELKGRLYGLPLVMKIWVIIKGSDLD